MIDSLLRKWLKILPHPFSPADRLSGFRYDHSILHAEFSFAQVLDRPMTGRIFFEYVIRDNLDIGHPSHVQPIFDRRVTKRTPGRFRTRVLTPGVTPALHVDYKHSSIKQYLKEDRAIRSETTINDTRDFGIGRRLGNLPALQKVGFAANRRLLAIERTSHDCILGEDTFQSLQQPVRSPVGQASGLRFGDLRVQTLRIAILALAFLPAGSLQGHVRGPLPHTR